MSDPVKCDICGAPATIHLTQIIDGKVRKVHLCAKCAATHNVADLPIIKFAEILTKKFLAGKFDGKFVPEPLSTRKCPKCGMTDIEFNKSQRFGCQKCYETFVPELSELLPKIQKTTIYAGRANALPHEKSAKKKSESRAGTNDWQAPELSIEQLKLLLENAVAHEDYELAAKTRDIIKAREKKATRKTTKKKVPAKKAVKPAPEEKKISDKKRKGGTR